jgi:hypothetical protein
LIFRSITDRGRPDGLRFGLVKIVDRFPLGPNPCGQSISDQALLFGDHGRHFSHRASIVFVSDFLTGGLPLAALLNPAQLDSGNAPEQFVGVRRLDHGPKIRFCTWKVITFDPQASDLDLWIRRGGFFSL